MRENITISILIQELNKIGDKSKIEVLIRKIHNMKQNKTKPTSKQEIKWKQIGSNQLKTP